jgi:hypothetical protein
VKRGKQRFGVIQKQTVPKMFREAKTKEVLDAVAQSEEALRQEYEPTAEDVAWAEQQVMTQEGDIILGYPNLKYRICHRNKMLVLQNPEELYEHEHRRLMHLRMVRVFQKIGWKVSERTL